MTWKACVDCGRPTPRGNRCAIHEQAERARRHAKLKASGTLSPHWKAVRQAVLARDGYRCTRCGAHLNLTVHLDPALGRNHWVAQPQDCTTLCRSCHGTVDAPRSQP